jgi:four helix bundle protein
LEAVGFKGLEVWQLGIALAKLCYNFTLQLPTSEQFGLSSQIRRAAASIPANIAEGYGRKNSGAYTQYLRIAKGSLNELETHLILCEELGLAKVDEELFDRIAKLGTKLSNLIEKIQGSTVKEELAEYDAQLRD